MPPNVAHLALDACQLECRVLPAGRQLRSLQVLFWERGVATPWEQIAVPFNLLDWLEKTLHQATVKVFNAQLTLGTLSMERYAERLSEVATCSIITLEECTLRTCDGCLSTHSVADMARHMGQHLGGRVTVTCTASKNSCKIVRVGDG